MPKIHQRAVCIPRSGLAERVFEANGHLGVVETSRGTIVPQLDINNVPYSILNHLPYAIRSVPLKLTEEPKNGNTEKWFPIIACPIIGNVIMQTTYYEKQPTAIYRR
ncbi:MAG TPA: hypothetical protein VJB66_05060 [Candidatus Nanoarchaeia archaeon]|nr:hypothetical protein [Candidatus Nanoarchaeia archaeon]